MTVRSVAAKSAATGNIGLWVWGLETDLQVTSIEARDRLPGLFGITAVAGGTTFFTDVQSALRWFGTARARLGWTVIRPRCSTSLVASPMVA